MPNETVSDTSTTNQPTKRVALFDLGYVFRRYWHGSEDEEQGSARKNTVRFIAQEASGYDAVALCKDSPPYNRRAVFGQYKANRDKASTVLIDQMTRTLAELERWGYRVIGVDGFEADDVIATLARKASKAGWETDIFTPDKDIRQALHWARTTIIDPLTGEVVRGSDLMTAPNFGIAPDQIPQFIALTGDTSDNLPGIHGLGPKTAAALIHQFGSVEEIWNNYLLTANHGLTNKAIRAEMQKPGAKATALQVCGLARLQDDLDLVLEDCVQSPRDPVPEEPVASVDAAAAELDGEEPPPPPEVIEAPEKTTALVRPADVQWERQLEPTSSGNAWKLAHLLHESKLYVHKYSSPQQVLAVMLDGRARGLDATTSLRCYNVIKGRVSMSSELMIAMVMSSAVCRYMQCVETTDSHATWETHRKGNPKPDRLTYTWEEAARAGYTATRGRDGSWQKQPKIMLRWRGGTTVARLVYPDITAGVYSLEEIQDFDR